jgi:hypothetical protein
MIVTSLAALPLLAWLSLLHLHGRFWQADQRLDPSRGERDRAAP